MTDDDLVAPFFMDPFSFTSAEQIAELSENLMVSIALAAKRRADDLRKASGGNGGSGPTKGWVDRGSHKEKVVDLQTILNRKCVTVQDEYNQTVDMLCGAWNRPIEEAHEQLRKQASWSDDKIDQCYRTRFFRGDD